MNDEKLDPQNTEENLGNSSGKKKEKDFSPFTYGLYFFGIALLILTLYAIFN